MKIITLILCIFGFLMMRPYQLQSYGLKFVGDDDSYFAHASAIVYSQFPSYKKEFYSVGGTMPMHATGPGVMAAPFVFVFSIIDRLNHSSIVSHRTKANIVHSWSLFGFIFATIFYLWLSCLLLYESLKYYVQPIYAKLTVIALLLFQGFPLYAYRRPIYSHTYELVIQAALLFCLVIRNNLEKKVKKKFDILLAIIVGFLIGFVAITRYNNALFAILWPLIIFGLENKSSRTTTNFWKNIFLSYGIGCIIVGYFMIYPMIHNNHLRYNGGTQLLLVTHSITYYLHRIIQILFGKGWGLIFTAPFTLLGLLSLFFMKNIPLKNQLRLLFILCVVDIYIAIVWGTQGGWYGYRYFIFSTSIVIAIPLAIFFSTALSRLRNSKKKYWAYAAILLISLPPIMSALLFEGNTPALSPHANHLHDTWNNLNYQFNVWHTIFYQPTIATINVIKGGPTYLIYVILSILEPYHPMPKTLLEKYGTFQTVTFIRSLIIYVEPLILLWIFTITRKFLRHRKIN